MTLTYREVADWLTAGLTARGYGTQQPDVDPSLRTMPRIVHGPYSDQVAKQSPGALVVVSVGGGAGLSLEQTYDQKFITVRAVGLPNQYDAAESLAYDLDGLLVGVSSPAVIGQTRVLYVARTGGAPELIDYDDADRYHFQATYLTPAMTGF
jgi:hypothetical protein